MPSRRKGYTLVELLIVVAIIGIIVAISVLNYMNAIQRARQKRTMGDLRSIGLALDAYNIDFNAYPPAAASTLPPGLTLPTMTLGNVTPIVTPTYLQVCPLVDGWNSWFTYTTGNSNKDYVVRSSGSDGIPETAPAYGPFTNFRQDIIFTNGAFIQFPDGIGQQ